MRDQHGTRTLQGIGVLVTRPPKQALHLCELLEERGATAWRLPALDIVPIAVDAHLQRAGRLSDVDAVIFTSANAVRFGVELLQNVPRGVALAAIGPATARALHRAGHPSTIEPQAGVDSEALLLHPRLCHVQGQHIVIVKGVGGRDLLETQLARRGARVTGIDVYARRGAHHSDVELDATAERIGADAIHIVTATSVDISQHLLQGATPALRTAYEGVTWLVPSARIADELRRLGCRAPQLRAASAEDHDLVSALETWRAGTSTA